MKEVGKAKGSMGGFLNILAFPRFDRVFQVFRMDEQKVKDHIRTILEDAMYKFVATCDEGPKWTLTKYRPSRFKLELNASESKQSGLTFKQELS